MPLPMPPMHDYNFVVQGVNLRARVSRASEDSPVVLLLHGFPETGYAWRNQVLPLHDAGWRVVTVDQRGFGQSGKPKGKDAYRLDLLAGDAMGIFDALGVKRGAIVGHDIGAIAAWRAAIEFPDRVSHLVAISGPHPSAGKLSAAGLPLAWMRLFPVLHEANLGFMNFRTLAACLTNNTKPGTITEGDLVHYREAWYREGAVPAMLAYFSAPAPSALQGERPRCPTTIIWGDKDSWYPVSQAEASARATGGDVRLVRLPTGHYPHLDAPVEVTSAILDLLGRQEKHREWRPPQW